MEEKGKEKDFKEIRRKVFKAGLVRGWSKMSEVSLFEGERGSGRS